MGALYIGAGVTHLLFPATFASIVPDYLPAHRALAKISGVAEIAGGVGVLLPWVQQPAAWGLVALLVAVFPANLWMAQHPSRYSPIPAWILWARLPLQVPLLLWAWRYTRTADRLPGVRRRRQG